MLSNHAVWGKWYEEDPALSQLAVPLHAASANAWYSQVVSKTCTFMGFRRQLVADKDRYTRPRPMFQIELIIVCMIVLFSEQKVS